MNDVEEAKFLLTHTSFFTFHKNGDRWLETWIEDGVFDGPYKLWSSDGKLFIDSNCIKGVCQSVGIRKS